MHNCSRECVGCSINPLTCPDSPSFEVAQVALSRPEHASKRPPRPTIPDLAYNVDVTLEMLKLELSKPYPDIKLCKSLLHTAQCGVIVLRGHIEQPDKTKAAMEVIDEVNCGYRGDGANDPDAVVHVTNKANGGTTELLNITPGSQGCRISNCNQCANLEACRRGI